MDNWTRIIERTSQGAALSDADIRAFIDGVCDGSVTDAQLGAYTMAVRYRGMQDAERTTLTLAMRDSGKVLSWPSIDGPVLDKHSTGGVGDWVSLVLAPLIASAGGYVPMISGRGLGHTGGTLDKLDSIPGFSTRLSSERFTRLVRDHGLAMAGQGPELAPADGRMYAVRNVCNTVESIPLIVSSILSKKLAEGLDGLVLDVKTGDGAFMRRLEDSESLARALCRTARQAGVACRALVTDMDQPLGRSGGNALEVREAIDYLTGVKRHPRMHEVVTSLSAHLLVMGGLAVDALEARARLAHLLDSGEAAERFATMVHVQGGPADLLERAPHYFPAAAVVRPVQVESAGWVVDIDTREVGLAILRLGGGRASVKDTIDPRVGISELCLEGDRIEAGDSLCMLHASREEAWQVAAQRIRGAVRLGPEPIATGPVIHESIE